MAEEKKGFMFPSAYTILFILIIIVAIATWIVPAGQYEVNEAGEPIPGSYHSVDSSEMAFKVAGSIAYKKACEDAQPTLLEPIMNVTVTTPEEFMGDIMGDLNGRRGKVLGMDSAGKNQVIKAHVPMAEFLTYAPDLRSMTGGRGIYTMEFSHYDEVPIHIAEKIVEEKNKENEK
jgi:elongation factor G